MLILTTVFCVVSEAAVPGKLKSVTYVSDAWVINFWNTESDHMEEELAQIAADGFNSIVLAVPGGNFSQRQRRFLITATHLRSWIG